MSARCVSNGKSHSPCISELNCASEPRISLEIAGINYRSFLLFLTSLSVLIFCSMNVELLAFDELR